MTTPMFAYLQLSLVGDARCTIVEKFEALARQYGGSIHGRVFCEEDSPVQVLWSLVRQADDELRGALVPHLQGIAARYGIGLGHVVGGAPPTTALWMLLDALERCEGEPSCLFVPSIEHFDNLGVSRETVLQRIAQLAPETTIIYLDSDCGELSEAERPGRLSECRPEGDREGLLVDVTVNYFADAETVVQLNTHRGLARAGLSDMVDRVDVLMHNLISAAAGDITAGSNTLRIQVLQPPGAAALVVDMWESNRHDRPVSATLFAIVGASSGGTVERVHGATGGTVTRCQLPLALSGTGGEADTVELQPSLQWSVNHFRSAS